MPSGQLFEKTSPAPRCLTRRDLRGTGSHTALQPRRHDNTASKHRTRGCVSSVTWHTTAQTHTAHCHFRTIAKATSQDSCRTTYGHQIFPLKWTVLPDVTVRPKTKRHATIRWQDTMFTVLCGMAVLSPYMTTWTSCGRLTRKLKRNRKRPHLWRLLGRMHVIIYKYVVS
jgi:hypothetical protein